MNEVTRYGFEWNNLEVQRICDDKSGSYLIITTDKQELEIRVTPGGKIKPFDVEKKQKTNRRMK